jgi:hypothetical protein
MYAGWDFVLWGLLLLAVFAWNLLSQALQQRRRQRALEQLQRQEHGEEAAPQSAPDPEPEAWGRAPVPVAQPVPPQPWGRSGTPLEVLTARAEPRPTPAPTPMAPAVVRTRYAARFRTREDFRAAVVGMTVLGPCRALEGWQAPGEPPLGNRAPVSGR